MADDFFSNLQAATSNIDDIVFNRFATISEINNDGTVNCREEEGLTHNNVLNPTINAEVGDAVVLMFMDNSVYDPVIIANITHDLKKSFDEINASLDEVNENIKNKADKTHSHVIGDVSGLVDAIYPVGSIYMNVNNANPELLFGGTWQQIEDTFLLASGSTYAAGDTGGSADAIVVSHNHTQKGHNHDFGGGNLKVPRFENDKWAYTSKREMNYTNGNKYYPYSITNNGGIAEISNTGKATPTINNSGESGTGKNMPPYLTVYMWKRIG